jgi:hypothetical protein
VTFSEFKTSVLAASFPLGVPENLTLDDYVVSGLIEAQRWIKCFRYRHDDVTPACNSFWHCGTTVVTAPRGRILRAYTVERGEDGTDWCHPVVLNPATLADLRRYQASFRGRWDPELYAAPASGRNLPQGFDVPTSSSDSISGRALTGLYALDPTACRLYVAPWLQTTESLVVEWQGIKRAWNDTDLVPDDPDFLRLISAFVDREYGRKWAASDLPTRERVWADTLADMIVTCEEETKLHGEPRSAAEAELGTYGAYVAPSPAAVTEDATESIITFVGDIGDAGDDAQAVAAAVAEANPDGWVVTLGNNKYPPNDAITGLDPYESYVQAGRLRAALGDTDLNDGNLGADVTSYAGNPGNGRYFAVKVGPVSIFVVDGGLTTAGDMVEPDGNYPGSRQWQEITGAILRDTSPWKIAVVHQAPFTSGDEYYPGESDLRWVSDLPVHAVLSAHSRVYERLTVRNRLHLVAGTGGLPLHGFGETYPGSEEQIAELGFLRLTATCTAATFDFVSVDGEVLDTVDLDAGVANQPPMVAPDDPRITDQANSDEVVAGEAAEFAIEAAGTAPLEYQWYRDGIAVVGATSATYTIESTVSADAGTYVCVVSNALGAVASSPVTLTVAASEYPAGGSIPSYATILELQESSESALIVAVAEDANGDLVHFRRSEDAGTDDGHMVVVTGSGTVYRRPTP